MTTMTTQSTTHAAALLAIAVIGSVMLGDAADTMPAALRLPVVV
jgi:hypothetical protein